ncbi:TrkH family potassium uptake protein [Roseovarius aquimarinus]|uniref:TrkH family potassium uptake protein n=1 Tax=Roseovarius aquimarinus TaxID=1229156 RepID=UPI00366C4E13
MVARALCNQSGVLLLIVAPPMLVGGIYKEWVFALSLAPQTLVLGALMLGFRGVTFPEDLRRVEAFAVFALIFVIASLLVAPPFVVLGMSPLDAVFEAVSGVTSTGLSVATEAESWPIVAHLMRGWIQWCGGFAIAFAGLAILDSSAGASLSMSQSQMTARDNLASIKVQARQALWSYVALTLIAVLLCLLLLPNWWEAVSIALAAVSTGGFTPRADSLASYSPLAQGVVIGICAATAITLLFYIRLWRDGPRSALRNSHALATLGLMAAGVALFVAVDFAVNRPGGAELYAGALNFLSGFTTAGFSTNEISSHVSLLPLLLVAMLIGGDVGSTAGGIKVTRLLVLFQIFRLSILRVRVPASAVTYLRDGADKVTADRLIGVAALLVTYLATMMLCWIVFLVSGIAPLDGLFEVVSALSTVGLSQGVSAPGLAAHLKATLIVAMLLGRLEFIALIVLCTPQTWIRRT